MEATYLIKVDETQLKRITAIGCAMDVIEVESISDLVRFKLMLKAMKNYTSYFISHKLEMVYNANRHNPVSVSDIFQCKDERYYSTSELIDMLTEIKSIKNSQNLSGDGYRLRIDKLLDQIIWNNRSGITNIKKKYDGN